MYQKCPICNGTGRDPNWNGNYCSVCHGFRIIHTETGLPPTKSIEEFIKIETIELKNLQNPQK